MEQQNYELISEVIRKQIAIHFTKLNNQSEWLDLKSAAKYANVSYNTFIKFRSRGLKVCEIEGIKRVKKSEIDRFLDEHSF